MLESISLYTCVFALINLLILFLVLKLVLFKPVMNFMDKRSQAVADDLQTAADAKSEALEMKSQYDEQLKASRVEGQKIVDDMTKRANQIYADTIAKAEEESRQIIARAHAEAEREHDKVLKDSKAEISGLALAAASKVIGANMDNDVNRRLVDKFLEENGAA